MIQWKQRLYAFLLRRILGPFLDASSNQKLHDSIDVSLNEGRFALTDLHLNAEYLNSILSKTSSARGLSIVHAKVDRLEIYLKLQENSEADETTSSSTATTTTASSVAWRAIRLGSFRSDSGPRVSLIAEIEVTGISVELQPCSARPQTQLEDSEVESLSEKDEGEQPQPKGIIGSYVDAALASLQLSLSVRDFKFKLWSSSPEKEMSRSWIEFRAMSAKFQETKPNPSSTNREGKEHILPQPKHQKILTFNDMSLICGESQGGGTNTGHSKATETTVAQIDGAGHVYVRTYDVALETATADSSSYLQQDIEFTLDQRLNISFHEQSVQIIHSVVDGLKNGGVDAADGSSQISSKTTRSLQHNDSEDDANDLKTLSVILKQYKEAHHLTENNNQFRGGILVPTNAYEGKDSIEEDEDGTFDVFFDANAGSIYNHASVMRESIMAASAMVPAAATEDIIHTKIRFRLMAGSIKINFSDARFNSSFQRPDEYILFGFEDIRVQSILGSHSMKCEMSVLQFQIEDAQIDNTPKSNGFAAAGGTHFSEVRLRIGSMLRFTNDSEHAHLKNSFDETKYNEEAASEAPCISFNLLRSDEESATQCVIAIAPMEFNYRERTISNISSLLQRVALSKKEEETDDNLIQKGQLNPISFLCSCKSITLKVPIGAATAAECDSLFERGYETLRGEATGEPSIGILFDGLKIEHGKEEDIMDSIDETSSLACSCHNVIVFVEAPRDGHKSLQNEMRRIDLLVARGRLEVNPYIPIAVKVRFNATKSEARESFPMIPAISSFKARQEDEDEDGDRLLLSQITAVDAYSMNDFRSSDPQPQMRVSAEKCTTIVSINIPEVTGEASSSELKTVLDMLRSGTTSASATPQPKKEARKQQDSSSERIALTLTVDKLSLALSESASAANQDCSKPQVHSHALVVDRFCVHTVVHNGGFDHARLMCHDPVFYEIFHSMQPKKHKDLMVRDRVKIVRGRCFSKSKSNAVPILYRSQLFTAISHESPSISIDVINSGAQNDVERLNIHCTVYHMTCRYDVDSKWCDRLSSSLAKVASKPEGHQDPIPVDEVDPSKFLIRVFLSVADCNLDYTAPSYFNTRSRMIVRIGDFRISGNITKPAGKFQTLSISLGDINAHICNEQQSYNVENSRLCRVSEMLNAEDCRIGFVSMSPPETLLREMGFIHTLSLDSLDAIVAIGLDKGRASSPDTTISISVGLLSLHACKDSFGCFSSTVGELQAKLTALSEDELATMANEQALVVGSRTSASSSKSSSFAGSKDQEEKCADHANFDQRMPLEKDLLNKKYHPDFSSFLLDGYDWTTIDHNPLPDVKIPEGHDHVALWYSNSSGKDGSIDHDSPSYFNSAPRVGASSRLNSQHFPTHPLSDPLSEGNMDAPKYAGTKCTPNVKSRILVRRLNLKIRLFDGYDWPGALDEDVCNTFSKSNYFVIEGELRRVADKPAEEGASAADEVHTSASAVDKRALLMDNLLDEPITEESAFKNMPLPEEKKKKMVKESDLRYFSRKTHRFLQITATDVQVRIDAFAECSDHRLASIMEVSAKHFFLMETVSSIHPIKLIGEWVNDKEHPRDSKIGALMMKMITWRPPQKVTDKHEICSDDCELTLQLLPMRCLIDQSAVSFTRAFFAGGPPESADKDDWLAKLHLIPAPRFTSFRVKPWKLKVDYWPKKLDVAALREGSIIELINLSPIEAMVITLNEVKVQDVVGFGSTFGGGVSQWIRDICATQLHKFLTNARPFEPFSNVANGMSDLVVLPYEAFTNGDSVRKAMVSGVSSLAGTIAFEALTTTSRLTKFAASQMARAVSESNPHLASVSSNPLPSRPIATPKGMSDVTGHAMESLARGVKAANYKVVIIPYRELSKHGTTGAIKSVIRGIPVLIVAPLSGATEAISYTLLGARNTLRPDIRKEEEATLMGLSCDVQY